MISRRCSASLRMFIYSSNVTHSPLCDCVTKVDNIIINLLSCNSPVPAIIVAEVRSCTCIAAHTHKTHTQNKDAMYKPRSAYAYASRHARAAMPKICEERYAHSPAPNHYTTRGGITVDVRLSGMCARTTAILYYYT